MKKKLIYPRALDSSGKESKGLNSASKYPDQQLSRHGEASFFCRISLSTSELLKNDGSTTTQLGTFMTQIKHGSTLLLWIKNCFLGLRKPEIFTASINNYFLTQKPI